MRLIDILISETEGFNTSYMFTISFNEYEKLEKMILNSGRFIKIYRNYSYDNESEYSSIVRQFKLI